MDSDTSKLKLHFFIDIYWKFGIYIDDISSHALPITNFLIKKECKNSLCFLFILILILIHSSCASKNNVSKLVNEVCAKTSNYSFCIESLYSDPHTPESDRYGLAYVAFGLAYLNATSTRDYIAKLLKKANSSTHYGMSLHRCANDYKKAVSAIEIAYNDLNSETFFELADLAGDASHAAEDCQATFKGTTHHSLLHFMNNALKGLCEICVVISKLFTGS